MVTSSGSAAAAAVLLACMFACATADTAADRAGIHHVVLLSVDGLHQVDLARYIDTKPDSAMAKLAKSGVVYTNVMSTNPSDSFPGTMALVTGGSPKSTGIWYDDSYDRTLCPPRSCPCNPTGTEVLYADNLDYFVNNATLPTHIDPKQLPLDPNNGCKPVYPHQYNKMNTIFEVVKAKGLRTAWIDKHPAYDIVNGPSGKGVDDLFTPELAGNGNGRWTHAGTNMDAIIRYDTVRIQALINQIHGFDHTGTIKYEQVPALLGSDYQVLQTAEATFGYLEGPGVPYATPTPELQRGLDFVDASITQITDALHSAGIAETTAIILTAKHGQSPINVRENIIVDGNTPDTIIKSVVSSEPAFLVEDDILLVYLKDAANTDKVYSALLANKKQLGFDVSGRIVKGQALLDVFGHPQLVPSRVPDIAIFPNNGTRYDDPSSKVLEDHGGNNLEDRRVALLVSSPRKIAKQGSTVSAPVSTQQVAPTILYFLGISPSWLHAVHREGIKVLPQLF